MLCPQISLENTQNNSPAVFSGFREPKDKIMKLYEGYHLVLGK